MADAQRDAISQNVEGARQLVSSRVNKIPDSASDNQEGAYGERRDVLDLDTPDEELILLADRRAADYAPYEGKINKQQENNLKWYLGRQKDGSAYDITDGPIAGNDLFTNVETFLPAALARTPDPVVYADSTAEGQSLADDVKAMLQYEADAQLLLDKLAQITRNWMVDLLGVLKHGWNNDIQDITTEVRDVKNFLFDPKGYVDVYGDFHGWIGERITITAEKLIEKFPDHKTYISLVVDDKLGTDCTYTEWWTDDEYFCTFKRIVLDKGKNYLWNYEEGAQNHFAAPKKPYTFLSVYSFQSQPHDVTSLLEQNIPNQNRVSRRLMQIDTNLQNANNGLAISAENYNQQTGKQAAEARQKGQPVLVPPGRPVAEAIMTLESPGLPAAFFDAVTQDQKIMRSSFGTDSLSGQGLAAQDDVRGKILATQQDASRIGGSIGRKVAQVADNTFNWWTHLISLFYDEPHVAAILGQMKSVEYIVLSNQKMTRKLTVTVAPDSMKPKDELTLMNQAMDLWTAKAIDIKSLLTILNIPDAEDVAGAAMLQQINPQAYFAINFPELAAQLQQMTAPQVPGQPTQPGQPNNQPQPESQPAETGAEPPNAALSTVPIQQ